MGPLVVATAVFKSQPPVFVFARGPQVRYLVPHLMSDLLLRKGLAEAEGMGGA